MRSDGSSGWIVGAAAVAAALCCAFPLVAGGALVAIAGIGLGGGLLAAAVLVAVVIGVAQHRRRGRCSGASRDAQPDVSEV